ncbi:hypothetical protein KKE06_03520 [Candidatus Micrarchaeota archaeon]|nr:hypothetical protein [Candidatus Micrarchaeota archaeon]MBU1930961.1 hypothetical protein [Candidatus Micrarchaeota archaeon]
MKRGQASLEALLVFAIFLGSLGLFVNVLEGLNEKSRETNAKTNAISASKKCAAIIDMVFANSGGKPRTLIHNCVPFAPHQIQVNHFSHEKTAFTIAEQIKLVQAGNQTVLEVSSPDHYQ